MCDVGTRGGGRVISDIAEVLRRAQTDYGFFLALQSDPEGALSQYSLTDRQRAAFIGDRSRLWGELGALSRSGHGAAEPGPPSPPPPGPPSPPPPGPPSPPPPGPP